MRNDFAVFICTHGRPHNQLTLETLLNSGYNGRWYLVVDDTDSTIQEYIDEYGADNIIIFDKNYYINSDRFDNGDNQLHAKCILYAKRAVEDIARAYGYKYFAVADDDITELSIRYKVGNHLKRIKAKHLDDILEACIDLMDDTTGGFGFGTVLSYFSGVNTSFEKALHGSCVLPCQFVVRNASVRVDWISWFAEDNITLLQSGCLGIKWLRILFVQQMTVPVGDPKCVGGMADTYRSHDSYTLNFNLIKQCPNRVFLHQSRTTGILCLSIKAKNSFPRLISGRYKK
jgi:hypothetical protein